MNDLLSAVRGGGGSDSEGERPARAKGGKTTTNNALYDGDIEEGYAPPVGQTELEEDMTNFFEVIERIKADMGGIRNLQREIVSSNEKGKTIVKTKAMQKHQADMQVGRADRRS